MPKRAADDCLRCTRCRRPIRAKHYVYACDRGHEFPVHRQCREDHLDALLLQPALKCGSGEGCRLVACRRSEHPDDPHATALLRRMLTKRARQLEVGKILLELERSGMIELHVHFGLHQTWYDVKCQRSEVEARCRAMLDALPHDAALKRAVYKVVMDQLVGG